MKTHFDYWYRKTLATQLMAIRDYEKSKGTYMEWLKSEKRIKMSVKAKAAKMAQMVDEGIINALMRKL